MFNVCIFLETWYWAQVDVLVFSLKVNFKKKCALVNWMVLYSPSSFLGFFLLSPQPALYFFNSFFLLNNLFVEWARLGERPGDEKMGPVRNPSQWGNLPEPPGGPAAGKAGDRCQFKHWTAFSLLLLSRVSLNFTCRGLQGTGCKRYLFLLQQRERGLKEGLDVAEFGSC